MEYYTSFMHMDIVSCSVGMSLDRNCIRGRGSARKADLFMGAAWQCSGCGDWPTRSVISSRAGGYFKSVGGWAPERLFFVVDGKLDKLMSGSLRAHASANRHPLDTTFQECLPLNFLLLSSAHTPNGLSLTHTASSHILLPLTVTAQSTASLK